MKDGAGALRRSGVLATAMLMLMLARVASASAEWTEVSSDHFVIYGTQPPATLQEFAERLELLHSAMTMALQRPGTKPSPSNRVTVYVIPRPHQVAKLANVNQSNIAGVYSARAGNSLAIVPPLHDTKSRLGSFRQLVLFHEYAHHFMATNSARAYPLWLIEGFAEFFGTAEIDEDTVKVGLPAELRAHGLLYEQLPLRFMLDYDGGRRAYDDESDVFYGRSWALFHMLFLERREQLSKYLQLLAQGQPALQAATVAFGNLDELDAVLQRYIRRPRMNHLYVARSQLTVGPIQVRALSPAENAVMPARLRSHSGVTPQQAAEVVLEARAVAEKFPDEVTVLTELAEAEVDVENYDAAVAPADRALARDPTAINAWIQKGHALTRKARNSAATAETWTAVRNHWVRANKVEPNNPVPLFMYYWTFLEQETPATANAVRGLEWALALAPFDADLRWTVAQQMISEGRLALAASTIAPLAYATHAGRPGAAKQLLEDIEAELQAQAAATSAASPGN